MLRRTNSVQLPSPRKSEETPPFLIDNLADHRAVYHTLWPLTEDFAIRRSPKMGRILAVLELLDPLETDWTKPVLVTEPEQVRVVKDELDAVAKRQDGSWLSDQARFMLRERAGGQQEMIVASSRAGEIAIQGVLF